MKRLRGEGGYVNELKMKVKGLSGESGSVKGLMGEECSVK